MKHLPVAVAILVAVMMPAAQADVVDPNQYANQTPYGDPATTEVATPPAGYAVDFLETVGRHGARSLTSDTAEHRALVLWNSASHAGKLTATGKLFKADVREFQAAEQSIGYGNLSAVGAAEWKGIGRRTAANYPGLFARAQSAGEPIDFETTTVQRTKDSATALRSSLRTAFPTLTLTTPKVNADLTITNGSTTAGRASITRGLKVSTTVDHARHVLQTLYTANFVKTIKDPVAAALDVYVLYCTSPGMRGETDVTFERYVPSTDRTAMAEAKDTQNFYRYGPGVEGQRTSFAQADAVLDDFFDQIDARLAGGDVAAVFRLAHGETTMPFAARIKAPGSQTQQPSLRVFMYSRNPWRGSVAGRLGGNVEWTLFTSDDGPPLVTMRYNEQPVPFQARCTPVDASGLFVTVSELKRCLA